MPGPPRLTDAEIVDALRSLPGWARNGDALHRTFRFADFVTAFAFMTATALVAERIGHHPDWSNAYHTVSVDLSTHDRGGITALDVELARSMSAVAHGA